jgi:clan AA aspartic protease
VITGKVIGLQACVDLVFRLQNQPEVSVEFVVDTGFAGALTLPARAVAALGLPYVGWLDAHLADNSHARVRVYEAAVVWDGQETLVAVLAMGNRPLLGTALRDGFNINADFADNGPLSLQRLGTPAP